MEKKNLHDVHAVYDGYFNTVSGSLINIHEPLIECIKLFDIASGLSKICRSGGQINEFYSVAEHCMYVATILGGNLQLEALLHDASEAYLGDVIKPLKVILGGSYSVIEDRFMSIIARKFGLKSLDFDNENLKMADKQMLSIEHSYFMLGDNDAFKKAGLKTPMPSTNHIVYRERFIANVKHAFYNRYGHEFKETI